MLIDKRKQFLEALYSFVDGTKERIWGEDAFIFDGKPHRLEERGDFSYLRYVVQDNDFYIWDNKRFLQFIFNEESDYPKIGKSLEENAQDIENEINPVDRMDYSLNSSERILATFDDYRNKSMNEPTFKTGFRSLDEALAGGFRDQLVVLGAVSSLGKTTLALELANRFARNGHDVLFISLEQSREELLSKSLSYCCAEYLNENGEDVRRGLTQNHIQDKKVFDCLGASTRALYDPSVERFKKYAKSLYLIEPQGQLSAIEIREMVSRHLRMTGKYPIVFVDYLQLLASPNERMTDKQAVDFNILALRQIVRDYKLPVFAISSVNRASYNEASSMSIFKESGAIEYSCDVALALEYGKFQETLNIVKAEHTNKGTATESDKTEAMKRCSENDGKGYRDVSLVVMKNRRGKKDSSFPLRYYSAQNFFKEA